MNLVIENILDLIEEYGEEDVTTILSGFSCPKNPDIENFLSLLFSIYLHEKNKGAILKTVNEEADAELFGI